LHFCLFEERDIVTLHFTYLNKLDYSSDKAQKHDETAKSRFNNGILEIVFTKRVDKGKRQANKQHEQFFFIQVLE
jgi:hypothetical protein